MNKYSVLINQANTQAWTGYVYADSQREAQRMATEIAEGLGGDYLDVEIVAEVYDSKKYGTGPLTGDY